MKVTDLLYVATADKVSQMDHALKQLGWDFRPHKLWTFWKVANAIHHTGQYIAPATQQQLGQIRHLVKKYPDMHVGWIMQTLIEYWVPFCKWLKDQGLVQEFPEHPHLGFFLKHAESAANYQSPKTAMSEFTIKPVQQLIAKT